MVMGFTDETYEMISKEQNVQEQQRSIWKFYFYRNQCYGIVEKSLALSSKVSPEMQLQIFF